MDNPRFTPEQFIRRPGYAQLDTELRRWLRLLNLAQRVEFIENLYVHNYRYAVSLARSSQLPITEVVGLLQRWLLSSSHNTSGGLINGLVPVIGEIRFWKAAAMLDLDTTMAAFLNYHSNGKLDHYRQLLTADHS